MSNFSPIILQHTMLFFQDQVTRAHEQEEMYTIKQELSILNNRYEKMKVELERSMERENELLKYKVSLIKSAEPC
jgi:hypothetical protein